MRIREATYSDIDAIAALYDDARQALKSAGVDQWQKGGPNLDTAFADVEDGICYVVTDAEGLVAVFICDFSGEPAYLSILDGEWLSNSEYAALHRIAVSSRHKGRGVGSEIIAFIAGRCNENGVNSIRCDTHRDNKPMQRLLEKNGFVRCGKVYYWDCGERIAFEKILDESV